MLQGSHQKYLQWLQIIKLDNCAKFGLIILISASVSACYDNGSASFDSGGLEPPPGFLERTDANCRVAAMKATDIGLLRDTSPSLRQLNGQSLFGYVAVDGRRVQCVVRHADESVSDIRMLGGD